MGISIGESTLLGIAGSQEKIKVLKQIVERKTAKYLLPSGATLEQSIGDPLVKN